MRRLLGLLLACALGATLGAPVGAQPGPTTGERESREAADELRETPEPAEEGREQYEISALPVYVPPERGAPSRSDSTGTRGPVSELPELRALAPVHTGLTTRAEPAVAFHLTKPTDLPVAIALEEAETDRAVAQRTLVGPFAAGVVRVDLAELDLRLETGVVYVWRVALVAPPEAPGAPRVAGAAIERVAPSPELEAELARAPAGRVAHVLARHGIWYDALDALTRRLEETPDDRAARLGRAALLAQVGLEEPARLERAAAKP